VKDDLATFLLGNQFISDAAYIDDTYIFVLGQFVAQFGDEDVQASLVEEGVITPEVEEDVAHVHHTVAVLAEAAQYFGLTVRQFLLAAFVKEELASDVELVTANRVEGGDFDFGCCVGTGTAYQCLDAYDEFLHAEWFLQVVVGTQFEAFDNIVHGRAGSEEKDRRTAVALPDAAYHLESVHAGHHDVGYHYVGMKFEKEAQAFFTICSGMDKEALTFEGVLDDHGKGLFVFDEEDGYRIIGPHPRPLSQGEG
jgi:hypothetical protein